MSKIKLNVVRTSKDMIFDCVFLALTVAIWGIIAWLISQAPDIVPTHFGPSGKPDAYGSPTFIIIPSVIMTVVALFIAFSIYLPIGSINLPFVEGPGNERQKKLGVLLSRIVALLFLFIMLFIAVYSLGMKNHDSILPLVVILSVVFGVTIVFTILMYRAK
jgi:uncharacterized membrane protein